MYRITKGWVTCDRTKQNVSHGYKVMSNKLSISPSKIPDINKLGIYLLLQNFKIRLRC